MTRFLLLSDCRTGGTMLRLTICKQGKLAVAPELLDPTQEGFRCPLNWHAFFADVWSRYDGWHLQRYQIPEGPAWRALVGSAPRILNLYREDTLAQYASWKIAMKTGRWHSRPESEDIPSIVFDKNEYERLSTGWVEKRAYCDKELSQLPRLDITYENIYFDWHGTWQKIATFLSLPTREAAPELPKMPEIDYCKVFLGWPIGVQL